MTKLYNSAGQPVDLGQLIGRGGEGAVYEIPGRPSFVAKVYHQPVHPDKALKAFRPPAMHSRLDPGRRGDFNQLGMV